MNNRARSAPNSDSITCEKYLNKLIRQENYLASKKSPSPKQFQDKFSHATKPVPAMQNHFSKGRPVQKQTPLRLEPVRDKTKQRHRSLSSNRSESKDKEAWGQLLLANRSRERVSSFSGFDPLRTLHFLTKELHTKLQNVMDDPDIIQMVADIQHALRRIPPEVSTFLHNPCCEYPISEASYNAKSVSTKMCQTPPTLYQEDTEKFQKIMEENTYRLEASCRQLEFVCTNLQTEKEMTEKELELAKENVESLCSKVKELEREIEEMSNIKIKQLEKEKLHLQQELDKALKEMNGPTVIQLKKLVDELRRQKISSEETCSRLEYDMTLLRMEKEKFVTMLGVRDREIKEIQDEMAKIQEHVNLELKKLNSETMGRVGSIKLLGEPLTNLQDKIYFDIGDTTLSSVLTNESERRDQINVIKESPCGDASPEDDVVNKMKGNEECSGTGKERDPLFENLLKSMSPSFQSFLNAHNL